MANLDFYALENDQRDLIQFVFAETDVVVFELYSECDRSLRQFRSMTELDAAFQLGAQHAAQLQLWSPSVSAPPVIRHIKLGPVTGHSFRYASEGVGLIQLYLDGMHDGMIHHTHFGHWNEAGARGRFGQLADECDWRALARISGRIQRQIRGRLAVAKLHSRPVHMQAYSAVQQGAGLRVGADIHRIDSRDLKQTTKGP